MHSQIRSTNISRNVSLSLLKRINRRKSHDDVVLEEKDSPLAKRREGRNVDFIGSPKLIGTLRQATVRLFRVSFFLIFEGKERLSLSFICS